MSYSDFISELKKNTKGKGDNFSRGDLVALATNLFNDADHEITVYVKKKSTGGDLYDTRIYKPGAALRNSLIAPILKSFGVDHAEIGKLAECQTSKAGGEALADFSMLLLREYVSSNGLGRKLTLPMTAPDQIIQTIQEQKIPEEERATSAIVRQEDGSYATVPTGKIVTTATHNKLKVTARIPGWLKTSKAVEK